MIDVRTIGAGGGSIGWVDPQGALHVGPQSAAASPGPACYGFGGVDPTVTDANLHLGLLDPDFYLGGRMKVYPDKSKAALRRLGQALGCDETEAAAGIVRIVESNMVNNISEVSVWRGYDARDLTLVVYGGGSGLHCVRMAGELGVKTVVSPHYPAIVSALGHIVSDVKHFYSRSYLKVLTEDFDQINGYFRSQEDDAARTISSELPQGTEVSSFRALDMRYSGQTHEIRVEIPNRELQPTDGRMLAKRFNAKHKELYGYSLPRYPVEVVTLVMEAVGSSPEVRLKRARRGSEKPSPDSLRGKRQVYQVEKEERSMVPCYDRERLRAGNVIRGPAVVEGTESSVLVPEGWKAELDGYANLIVRRVA